MARLVWATDIHLDHARAAAKEEFLSSLEAAQADFVLVTGDLGEASTWHEYVALIEGRVGKPVWFVLGNHDFYGSSVGKVRERARKKLWLPAHGAVLLSEETALVGHDGWADGRYGDYDRSRVMLNDYLLVSDLVFPSRHARLQRMRQLAGEAAEHFRRWLPVAAERRDKVLVAIHAPPFREACWHEGRISDDDWLPHFTCAAAGDAVLEVAAEFPGKQFTVLCGHTHGGGYVRMSPNVEVWTGAAVYGAPAMQRVLEV